jgi:O-antigen/teichoic acid export membrane protein
LLQSVKFVFLESQGNVADVATLRLKINFYSTSLLLGVLACGGGLWAVSVVPSVNAIASTWWLYRSPKSLAYRKNRNLDTVVTLKDIRQIWRQEIFPLQWRMSLSWLSGYFIFQLITPITFSRFGPVVAGQLGFAISAMNSILFVATTFTTAIAPRLSSLFHSGKIHEFNAMFDLSFKRSCAVIILLSQLFVLMVYLLSVFQISISFRFLEWQTLLLYSFSVIVSAVIYCWAIYLRSQAIEPLALQSMATAVVMVPLIWAFSYVSLGAMLGAMLLVSIGSAIAVWRIYARNRKQLGAYFA